ncbi:TetR family transcriptional regulator [Kribbella sp. NPDC049584]|uniref:TetR/AcrR family transcriptional regulator n=1 Tax=Kribbella sp. NPDC049584 TaxID=3154833 RepID=UPI003419D4F1
MPSPKPLRADARRNRDQLVATARIVFGELGTQAPLDEIARRARIGNATLYRHFPTRDDLIVAVYAEEVAELCAVDDGVDLFDWLERFVRHVAEKGDLARTLEPSTRRSELHDAWHASMVETAARLVERAQRDGRLRADVAPLDLLVLCAGMAAAEPGRVKRMLQMVWHGVGTS